MSPRRRIAPACSGSVLDFRELHGIQGVLCDDEAINVLYQRVVVSDDNFICI